MGKISDTARGVLVAMETRSAPLIAPPRRGRPWFVRGWSGRVYAPVAEALIRRGLIVSEGKGSHVHVLTDTGRAVARAALEARAA